ncbi:MAG: hypothetical protein WDO14_06815 [Bacteroidota bacterium]
MNLTNDQRDDIRNFLLSRGLAFKPLLDEMSDHVACDLENLMNEGMSYEDAWKQTINGLPENHFNQIQKETMETINHRFTISRVFTYIGMISLIIATIFKIMHLRGADGAVLIGISALGLSLLAGSVSGIYFNRDKEGAMRVVAIVAGIVLVMIAYMFKILHLPGADQMITLGVLTLLVSMVINTQYVYNNASGRGNLFTFLHGKHSPGIERFLLIMLPFLAFISLKLGHLIVIFAAGLQFIALVWSAMEKDTSKNDWVTLGAVITTCVCFAIPMFGELVVFNLRLLLVTVFSFAGAFLCFRLEPSRSASSYLVCIAPIMFFASALVKLGWMNSFADNWPLNIIVSIAMVAAILLSPKTSITRTFMILSLAGYLLEL